ncbi:hypothetical protein [Macrococcus armenti]|uniref:hypothetical protein n=1 Tax=Macrococcus armenti TaxID=2875764 RepID=UPI001CCF28F4|nr:hypothetical protein [Macrococcus armenti]UBH15009.1 hypothetical protein LAU44_09745 [Macrococcus armenti]UBH17368.1 hypothetical protein LAU39_09770 [Macrococcus armenti]UBH19633.1 hypothetical protein LAU40_09750 [Macrococcus armenti]
MAYKQIISKIENSKIDKGIKLELLDIVSSEMESNPHKSLSDVISIESALTSIKAEVDTHEKEVETYQKPKTKSISEIARKKRIIK